jgi:transcription elongation factor Elf1
MNPSLSCNSALVTMVVLKPTSVFSTINIVEISKMQYFDYDTWMERVKAWEERRRAIPKRYNCLFCKEPVVEIPTVESVTNFGDPPHNLTLRCNNCMKETRLYVRGPQMWDLYLRISMPGAFSFTQN